LTGISHEASIQRARMTTERIFLDERSADRDEVLANAARGKRP
jgi:hypothetical protein